MVWLRTFILAVVLAVAIWVRWDRFELAQVYSDSLSPFVGGIQFLEHGYAKPPNPEADHWLWVSTLPFLLFANNLEQLFLLRFAGGAILVVFALWSAVLLFAKQPKKQLIALVGIGLLLSFDAGLLETLQSSFRGYFSPEWFSVATFGVVLYEQEKKQGRKRGLWLAIAAAVIAGGQHPLALGALFAFVPILFAEWRESHQHFWIALGMMTLFFIPRLVWIFTLLQCDAGGIACLTDIAVSSSENNSALSLLWRLVEDHFWIEKHIGAIFLAMGCWFARKHFLARWTLWAMVGIILLGLSISTLRPYHFRVLTVPMVVWSIVGWLQFGQVFSFVLPLWLWSQIFWSPKPMAWRNNATLHDQLAEELCQEKERFWVEANDPENFGISLQAIAVSYWLQDCSVTKLQTSPESIIFLDRDSQKADYPRNGFYFSRITSKSARQKNQKHSTFWGYDFAVVFFPEENIILE